MTDFKVGTNVNFAGVERGKDMSAPIGNAKRQLESLRRERNEELARLEEEKHVTPEEPELETASLILGSAPHSR